MPLNDCLNQPLPDGAEVGLKESLLSSTSQWLREPTHLRALPGVVVLRDWGLGYERQSNQDRGQSGYCYGDTCLPSTIRQRVPSHCWVSIAPQRDWTVTGTREQPHHGPCCLLSVRPFLSSLSTFLLSPSSTSSLLPSSLCPHFILFFSCCPFLLWISFHHLCAHMCTSGHAYMLVCIQRPKVNIWCFPQWCSTLCFRSWLTLNLEFINSTSLAGYQTPGIKPSLLYSVLGLQKHTAAPGFTHESWGPKLRCSTWTAGTFPSESSPLPVSFCKF